MIAVGWGIGVVRVRVTTIGRRRAEPPLGLTAANGLLNDDRAIPPLGNDDGPIVDHRRPLAAAAVPPLIAGAEGRRRRNQNAKRHRLH